MRIGASKLQTVGAWNQPFALDSSFETVPARQELRAFILADFNVLITVQLLLVDAGAHFGAGIESVADAQRFHAIDEAVTNA